MGNGRLLILPYKFESEGAASLKEALGVKRIIPTSDSEFVGRTGDVIINWGNGNFIPKVRRGEYVKTINQQDSVRNAVNKLTAMRLFENHGVSIPRFRTSLDSAIRLFTDDNVKRVFMRTVLDGSAGKGIIIARNEDELRNYYNQVGGCRLFVEGIPKLREYRVHVFNRSVIDFQEKRRRAGAKDSDDYDPAIRNLENGWVYVREGVRINDEMRQEAINAVSALGLDFGAVDLAIDKRDESVKVFEVNTSPGLEGQTLTSYVNAINKLRNK